MGAVRYFWFVCGVFVACNANIEPENITTTTLIPIADTGAQISDKSSYSLGFNTSKNFGISQRASDYITAYACDGGGSVEITCPKGKVIEILDAFYGRVSNDYCRNGPINTYDCHERYSFSIVQKKCQNKESCKIGPKWPFYDACPYTFKYLEVKYYCTVPTNRPPSPPPLDVYVPIKEPRTVHVCDGGQLIIYCHPGYSIEILDGQYGRWSYAYCNRPPINTLKCWITGGVTEIAKRKCDGRESCDVHPWGELSDPCYGTLKYLEIKYICRRKTDILPTPLTGKLTGLKLSYTCDGNGTNMTCPNGKVIEVTSSIYGRLNDDYCPDGPIQTYDCKSQHSFGVISKKCNNKNNCFIAPFPELGDPCYNTFKYLEVQYDCIEPGTKPRPTTPDPLIPTKEPRVVHVCDSGQLIIYCNSDEDIEIVEAGYGRWSYEWCNRQPINTLNCYLPATEIVKSKCDGFQTCTVYPYPELKDPCNNTLKYLEVKYICKKIITEPITPPPVVTEKPISGKVEIVRVCENNQRTIKCEAGQRLEILDGNYGRLSDVYCRNTPHPLTINCRANNSLTILKYSCNGREECFVDASNSVFGDPCRGNYKYLEIHYICKKRKSPVTDPPVIIIDPTDPPAPIIPTKKPPSNLLETNSCEGTEVTINCGTGMYIRIVSAVYGRLTYSICPTTHGGDLTCNADNSYKVVNSLCGGKTSCTVSATNNVFGDPCVNVNKYLQVQYFCEADISTNGTNVTLEIPVTEYYWRDYIGYVPDDAFECGRTSLQGPLYVGHSEIYCRGNIVNQITRCLKQVLVPIYGALKREYRIQILCTRNKDIFSWRAITTQTIHSIEEPWAVFIGGGEESSYDLGICRINFDSKIYIGKVIRGFCDVIKNGEEITKENYEILLIKKLPSRNKC